MPSTSDKQRRLMAIAEHHPEEVYAKNRGVLKMSRDELHDFAHTRGMGGAGASPVKFLKREGGCEDMENDSDD